MPSIAFHFNAPDKLDYACRFIRKALRHDARVTVVAPMDRLRALSGRLWKFAGHEFLAHAVYGDDAQLFALAPVHLVEQSAPAKAKKPAAVTKAKTASAPKRKASAKPVVQG